MIAIYDIPLDADAQQELDGYKAIHRRLGGVLDEDVIMSKKRERQASIKERQLSTKEKQQSKKYSFSESVHSFFGSHNEEDEGSNDIDILIAEVCYLLS
jgi:hypothetical protein